MSLVNEIRQRVSEVLRKLRSYYSFPRKTVDGWRRMSIESWLKRVFRSSEADAVEMLDSLTHLCVPHKDLMASISANTPLSTLNAKMRGKALLTGCMATPESELDSDRMGEARLRMSTEIVGSGLDGDDTLCKFSAAPINVVGNPLAALEMIAQPLTKSNSPPEPSSHPLKSREGSPECSPVLPKQKSPTPPNSSHPLKSREGSPECSPVLHKQKSDFKETTPEGSQSSLTRSVQREDGGDGEDDRHVDFNEDDESLLETKPSRCVVQ